MYRRSTSIFVAFMAGQGVSHFCTTYHLHPLFFMLINMFVLAVLLMIFAPIRQGGE